MFIYCVFDKTLNISTNVFYYNHFVFQNILKYQNDLYV